jgi:CDP-diacylglycerol---glycerol-3-phosphate 3-phosphatidyltransferase
VIKERFGRDFDAVVLRILPFIRNLNVEPDHLTLAGVALSGVAGAVFALGIAPLAGVALLAAGFCDLADGIVARQRGKSTLAGGFFDSSMDRLSDLLIFSGILIGNAVRAEVGLAALTCAALIGSVMTSYTRARAERHLAEFTVGLVERGERFGVLVVFALFDQLVWGLALIAVGSTVTAVQRTLAARRLLDELEQTGQDPTRPPRSMEVPAPAAEDA